MQRIIARQKISSLFFLLVPSDPNGSTSYAGLNHFLPENLFVNIPRAAPYKPGPALYILVISFWPFPPPGQLIFGAFLASPSLLVSYTFSTQRAGFSHHLLRFQDQWHPDSSVKNFSLADYCPQCVSLYKNRIIISNIYMLVEVIYSIYQ